MRRVRGFRRAHKACVSCRKRRLKCDQGDPDDPSDGPCSRCRRERRVCRFEGGLGSPDPESTLVGHPGQTPHEVIGRRAAIALTTAGIDYQPTVERQRLISSSLDNPNDALRIAADRTPEPSIETQGSGTEPDWQAFVPVKLGLVSVDDARYLLHYYCTQLHPLYPLLHPRILLPQSIAQLITSGSLLLVAIIALSSTLARDHCHSTLWDWLRVQIGNILEGSPNMRRLDTVEAILLLAEWPVKDTEESADDVQYITRDNARSWSYIGLATRLAQELDLQEMCMKHAHETVQLDWRQERELRTWLYCYNADRQISVRLGRSAVIQPCQSPLFNTSDLTVLTSLWWERLAALATRSVVWNRGMPPGYEFGRQQGLIAALMGTIHDRLFTDSDVTAALLRTGQWENILRNLALEIAQFSHDLAPVLARDEPGTELLDLEMNYLRLYGNGIALRALQERLMRIHRDGTLGYTHRSLFNLAEGPFILVAIEAATEILSLATTLLSRGGVLQKCPTRTFHRILYAATFLLKAMAVGVVEDGGLSIHPLLETTILTLDGPSNIARGMSRLLKRMLHAHHIIAQGDPTDRTPDPTFLPPENLAFDRQQDEAFLDIWGKELRADPLFAFWLNDEYA